MKMRRRILSLLLCAVMLLGIMPQITLPTYAANIVYERDDANLVFSSVTVDGTVTGYSVDKYNGDLTALELPDTWNDGVNGQKPVVSGDVLVNAADIMQINRHSAGLDSVFDAIP